MKFEKLSSNKSKKGISSIVGGIFFLVLMTAGFTVYYVALDSQSQMLDTQKIIADTQVGKIKEDFVIAASSDPGDNRLSIQVINRGHNPIEVADVWIINKTDASQNATRHNVDYRDSAIPVGHSGNILFNTPLYLVPEIYDIKVVSSLGTIKTVEYDVNGGSNILNAELLALPPDVRVGENVTLALIVTNTGQFTVDNVAPDPLTVTPDYCAPLLPVSLGPSKILPAQSVIFLWECTLFGPIGFDVDFSNVARGTLDGAPVVSNIAIDTATIRDFSTGGTIVLNQELLSRPEIFMTIPSPYGDDPNDLGLWGINVVNPTPGPMEVSKIAVTALTSRPNKNDKLFDETSSTCAGTTVAPTPASWSCPVQNQLMWKNFTTPVIIPGYSVFPFVVRAESGALAGAGDILETILISTNVFTTLGQFGKTSYGSSMANDGSAIVNVFLSSVKDSTTPSNIRIEKTGILSGTPTTFYVTIADFDAGSTYRIDSGSRLIINIPRNWIGINYPSDPDFNISTSTNLGQTQIIGELTGNIVSGGKSLEFTATPPCVSDSTMYVMYILADGTVSASGVPQIAVGPLAEIILQVVPEASCT